MTIYLQNGSKIEDVKFIQERRDDHGLVYFHINAKIFSGEIELYRVYNLYRHEILEIKIEIS